jgi:putative redox protein
MEEEQVTFVNHQRETLTGTLHRPASAPLGGVVMGHCFTCSRHIRVIRQICSELALAGFLALRFDFSGNGQSDGLFQEASYSKHIREMQHAAEFMAGQGADDWIAFAGHSMGAMIALLTAPRLPQIRAVCALAGRISGLNASHFFNPAQRAALRRTGSLAFTSRGRQLRISQDFFSDAARYDLPRTVSALNIPILAVHGDQDEIVPVAEAYQARKLNTYHIELLIIPGADHMFSGEAHRQQTAQAVTQWFTAQRSAT